MVTFFAPAYLASQLGRQVVAHKITSPILGNLLLRDPLGGISKIDKATGGPISGSVSRLWHNILYSYFDVEPLSSQSRLGHYFFTGPDFGHAVLYRTEADGSLPDCPSVERCDLEMPAAPHLDPEPIPVDVQPYNQQELPPLTLEDYPVVLTPFCLPLEPATAAFSVPDTLCLGEVLVLEAAATDLPAVSNWEVPGLLPEPLDGDTVMIPISVFIPTAFSPNNDGMNDVFEAYGPEVEIRRLRIFDRWGGLLFDQMGAEARWDGWAAGEAVNAGTYLYLIDYRNVRDGSLAQLSGLVHLVK